MALVCRCTCVHKHESGSAECELVRYLHVQQPLGTPGSGGLVTALLDKAT